MRAVPDRVKEWMAGKAVGAFGRVWKVAQRYQRRPLLATDHYYLMRLFRFFFRSYYLWLVYPNPLDPSRQLRLKVNLCENNQLWLFRLRERYERDELMQVAEALHNAEMFVDVGANVGVYAVTIAQAFPDKHVVAFEPLRGNFESLQVNIAGNHLSNCVARPAAVSDAGEPMRFYVNPIHDGGGSLRAPAVYRTGDVKIDATRYQQAHPAFRPWEEVETVRLDTVLSSKAVLKIDVEGTEPDVLRSGSNAFRAGLVDLMIVEVLQETVDDVLQLMEELQFDCALFPYYERIERGVRLPWFVRNIVCVRRDTPAHARISRRWQST